MVDDLSLLESHLSTVVYIYIYHYQRVERKELKGLRARTTTGVHHLKGSASIPMKRFHLLQSRRHVDVTFFVSMYLDPIDRGEGYI